jgi:hypothetical protein
MHGVPPRTPKALERKLAAGGSRQAQGLAIIACPSRNDAGRSSKEAGRGAGRGAGRDAGRGAGGHCAARRAESLGVGGQPRCGLQQREALRPIAARARFTAVALPAG